MKIWYMAVVQGTTVFWKIIIGVKRRCKYIVCKDFGNGNDLVVKKLQKRNNIMLLYLPKKPIQKLSQIN